MTLKRITHQTPSDKLMKDKALYRGICLRQKITQKGYFFSAGWGNRTPMYCLEGSHSTIKLIPHENYSNIKYLQCAPGRSRTHNPLFRRQVLYPLSYRRPE